MDICAPFNLGITIMGSYGVYGQVHIKAASSQARRITASYDPVSLVNAGRGLADRPAFLICAHRSGLLSADLPQTFIEGRHQVLDPADHARYCGFAAKNTRLHSHDLYHGIMGRRFAGQDHFLRKALETTCV